MVRLEFRDVDEAPHDADALLLEQQAAEKGADLPAVIAGDRLLDLPWFDAWSLVDTIEAYIRDRAYADQNPVAS